MIKEFQFTREELVALLTAHGSAVLSRVDEKMISKDEVKKVRMNVEEDLDLMVEYTLRMVKEEEV